MHYKWLDYGLQSRTMFDLTGIPGPAERRLAIRIRPEAEKSLRSGHPWLFEDSIVKLSHQGQSGDLAVIFDRKNRFLGVGLYDPHSTIRVRILQHEQPTTIDSEWFRQRINKAIALRSAIDTRFTNGYRLVHGENDGLPGLIVDRYGANLVLKIYSSAWVPYLTTILPILDELFDLTSVVLRLSRATSRVDEELYGLHDGLYLIGDSTCSRVEFFENSLNFEADLIQGLKTGFYLDQRENRARLEGFIQRDRGLVRVLNLFAYSGAFALYAARAGARTITSVDLNMKALESSKRTFQLNETNTNIARAKHNLLKADVFDALDQLKLSGEIFDVIVVDPPSFASRRNQVEPALRAYERLVTKSLALLNPGGLLAMFSCSSQVSEELFFRQVHRAARRAGRSLREIERSRHPVDHPIGFAQGAYLKGLFAYVD